MDPKAAKEEAVSKLLKDLKFLIADASSSRKSIRALMSAFKIKPAQVDTADTVSDAIELIKARKPNIIFADLGLGDSQGLSLVEVQKAELDPKAQRVFFLSTSSDSNILISGAVEETVDGVIIKPFTMDTLQKVFMETCLNSLDPPPYQKTIKAGLTLVKMGKLEDALKLFEQAKKLDPNPALAWAGEGSAHQAAKNWDAALKSFEQGLAIEPKHYRCLVGALECCVEAGMHEKGYEFGQRISKDHTMPLQKIPDLIRISILTGRYPEVLVFYGFADAIMKVNPSASAYLGAGLVVCGIFFTRQSDREKAMDAFRKAEVASQGNAKIQKRLLAAMLRGGFGPEYKALLKRLPAEVQNSAEVRMAELEELERAGSAADILKAATELHQSGMCDKRLFEIMIRRSVEMKRKEAAIQELLEAAVKAFPDAKEHFETLTRA